MRDKYFSESQEAQIKIKTTCNEGVRVEEEQNGEKQKQERPKEHITEKK